MDEKRLRLMANAAFVFSPGAPIDKHALFAGRTAQVRDVINAINQRGQHVILFGERGVGKTSLANVLTEFLTDDDLQGLVSAKINCDGSDDFSSLWHKVFREVPICEQIRQLGFVKEQGIKQSSLDKLLSKNATPNDIRWILSRLKVSTIIIIDEIDRIQNGNTTALLADTVKTLSDHSVEATLVFVGVADAVDELIGEHQSIERSLLQVRMPRMSRDELFEVLEKALDQLKMSIAKTAKRRIGELSQGLPHYTHLLGLHAAQTAIADGRTNINPQDVVQAVSLAVEKAQQSIRSAHHKAVSSARTTLYTEVLLACALTKPDALGYFAAADVRRPMTRIMGRRYDIPAFSRHLNEFCEEKRGPILQKTGSRRTFRFRFVNPLVQPFVIMDGLAKGLIGEDDLRIAK